MSPARQLPLALPTRAARGREAFFVSAANARAAALIDGWRDWPEGKLALIGPQGAGKTHLVHVWAREAGAEIIAAAALTAADPPALAAAGAVAVEDADRLAGLAPEARRAVETALFHLHNLLAAAGGALLVTGRAPPADWALSTPDLASRLAAATTARLDPPDDALLGALLVKLFADRQVAVRPELIEYLVLRIERSFAAAQRTVATLDVAAMAAKRPITRRLAAQALGWGTRGDSDDI